MGEEEFLNKKKIQYKREPWGLKKIWLCKIGLSGTIVKYLTNANSPHYVRLSCKNIRGGIFFILQKFQLLTIELDNVGCCIVIG